MIYKFIIHKGNSVEGETDGDPLKDEWIIVKRGGARVAVQMIWVTQFETYS